MPPFSCKGSAHLQLTKFCSNCETEKSVFIQTHASSLSTAQQLGVMEPAVQRQDPGGRGKKAILKGSEEQPQGEGRQVSSEGEAGSRKEDKFTTEEQWRGLSTKHYARCFTHAK